MTPGRISSWGQFDVPAHERRSEDLPTATTGATLSRGLGRSYGDSSFPSEKGGDVVGTVLADRILAFDTQTGRLRAEAGLALHAMTKVTLPRGFFTPVTPGTAYVTLGGMVASDVHGKNHHRAGTIGEHVTALTLRLADGRIIECSRATEPDLFLATLGGMGLTGHILEVELTLEKVSSPWIHCESERLGDIDEYLSALERGAAEWPMTVGWIDCLKRGKHLGRGILQKGRWATKEEAPAHFPRPPPKLSIPFYLPSFTVNPLTIRAFNAAYYWKHLRRRKQGIVSPDAFFYPLDGILHWNRVYGRRGMTQYQCVLPRAAGRAAVRGFLEVLTRTDAASFLCVIKDCGPQGSGLLSFPMAGVSIAVDVGIRPDTQQVVDALNEYVLSQGGRIYLTKDTFTRADHFRQMEPRLEKFLEVKRKWDPEGKIQSAQSLRLFGEAT